MWPCMEGTEPRGESGTCGQPASPTVQLQGLGKSLSLRGLHCSAWAPVKVARTRPGSLEQPACGGSQCCSLGLSQGAEASSLTRRARLPSRRLWRLRPSSVTGAPILMGGSSSLRILLPLGTFVSVQMSPSPRDTPTPSFEPGHLCEVPIAKGGHILRLWEFKPQHSSWGGHNSARCMGLGSLTCMMRVQAGPLHHGPFYECTTCLNRAPPPPHTLLPT